MTALISKRLLLLVPQLLGLTLVVFLLISLTPGNPGRVQLGAQASDAAVAQFNRELGLDKPWYMQYVLYLSRIVHGDFGTSLTTGNPVLSDIVQRAPATLELLTLSFLLIGIIALVLGVAGGASRGIIGRLAEKVSYGYSLLAGAVPDFWFGLVLIFFFTYKFPWAALPSGQLSNGIEAPPTLSGSLFLDSALVGDWNAFTDHMSHLVLPVAVLVFINGAPILRMMRNNMDSAMSSGYVHLAVANGVPSRTAIGYGLRLSLPPVVTLSGVWYTVLISGAVLTETIFGWGGLGQYTVDAVLGADWAALQGVILVTAVASLLIYLAVDVLQALMDPRVRA